MKLLILSALLLGLIGCGTGGGVKYDAEAVSRVQRVGIASFTLLQAAAVKDTLKPPPSPSGMKSVTPGINTFVKTSAHADAMLNQLKTQLETRKKWKIMEVSQLKSNATYIALFNEKMRNWQNRMAPKEDTQFLISESLLDDDAGKNLNKDERDRLMKALGLDALAFLKVDVELKSPYGLLNGLGSRKPSATTYLVVYTLGSDKPIWEAWHEVKEPESSISFTDSGLSQENMNQASLRSTKKSFDELMATLEEPKATR